MPAALTGFPPVYDQHTRILILGSFPGVASLVQQQYYAHPRNQFWQLISALIKVDLVALPYDERLPILLAHHIGLWDVIAHTERKGSLDTNIKNPIDNDLTAFMHQLPHVHTIGFNGGTAAKHGLKALGKRAEQYRIVCLPSSSPAHTMPYAEKLQKWQTLQADIPFARHGRSLQCQAEQQTYSLRHFPNRKVFFGSKNPEQ